MQGFGRSLRIHWLWFIHIGGDKTCSIVFSSRTCSSVSLVYRNGVSFVAARRRGEAQYPSHNYAYYIGHYNKASAHSMLQKVCSAYLLADAKSCGYVNHRCAAHEPSVHVRVAKAISRGKGALGAKVLLSPGATLLVCDQQEFWSE